MTFDELRLLCAIHELEPGGRDKVSDTKRLNFGREVAGVYTDIFRTTRFPWEVDQVMETYLRWRKNTDTKIKAAIAMAHGFECFWRHRGKGPCCSEAEAGHLVPNSRGGPLSIENCIIECRSHNNQRRAMTVEEYLQSSDKVTNPCPK